MLVWGNILNILWIIEQVRVWDSHSSIVATPISLGLDLPTLTNISFIQTWDLLIFFRRSSYKWLILNCQEGDLCSQSVTCNQRLLTRTIKTFRRFQILLSPRNISMFAFLNYASSVEENVPVIIVVSVSESERCENITTILIITYIIEKKNYFLVRKACVQRALLSPPNLRVRDSCENKEKRRQQLGVLSHWIILIKTMHCIYDWLDCL